jgi:DNA-binding Lrp family transcriptional regulator
MGLVNEIQEALQAIPEVKDSYQVFGVYDIVARIEVGTNDMLKEVVFSKVKQIDGIISVSTLIVMPAIQSVRSSEPIHVTQ